MKSKASGPLRKIIEEILIPLGQEGRLEEAGIMSAWSRIVGSQVADHSFPWHLKKGVLTVGVSGSAWLNQLHFFRDDIARKVNQHLGEPAVHAVRLVLRKNPVAPPGPAADAPGFRVLAPPEIAEIETACLAIADPEVRDAVRRFLLKQAACIPTRP